MLNFEKPNLTENHQQVPSNDQQAPIVNVPDACAQKKAHRKDGSKLIVVTRCFRLAPETRKGRGTTRSSTGYLPRG